MAHAHEKHKLVLGHRLHQNSRSRHDVQYSRNANCSSSFSLWLFWNSGPCKIQIQTKLLTLRYNRTPRLLVINFYIIFKEEPVHLKECLNIHEKCKYEIMFNGQPCCKKHKLLHGLHLHTCETAHRYKLFIFSSCKTTSEILISCLLLFLE